jgi:protein Tex
VPDAKEALAGARDILTEQLAENAALLGRLRAFLQREAFLTARLVKGQEAKGAKFSDYFAHTERSAKVPSHRALAMMRGANEGVLALDIAPDPGSGLPQVEAMLTAALAIGAPDFGDSGEQKPT